MLRDYKNTGLCLILLLLAPVLATGAGLGRIKVNSGLGEPLSADIELLETSPDEANGLVAKIATNDEYSAAGLQDVIVPQGLRIAPATRADGSRVLHVTTSKPVNEPFVELLIHVDSDSVHLVRQYTLLLDPPLSKLAEEPEAAPSAPAGKASVARAKPPVTATTNADVVQADELPPEKPRRKRKPVTSNTAESAVKTATATPPDDKPVALTGDTYTTQSGDVFGKVAQRYQPEGVSLKKVMAAFYAANPHAFLDGDMNQLKANQVLSIPSPESMGAAVAKPKVATALPPVVPEGKPANTANNGKPADNQQFVLQISPGDTSTAEDHHAEDQSPTPNASSTTTPPASPAQPSVDSTAAQSPGQPVTAVPPAAPAQAQPQPAPQPTLAEQVNRSEPSTTESLLDKLLWIGIGVLLALTIVGLFYLLHLRRLATMQRLQDEALYTAAPAQEDHDGEEDEFFKPAKSRIFSKPKPVAEEIEPEPLSQEAHIKTQILPPKETGAVDHGPLSEDSGDFDIHEVDPLVEAEIYVSYGRMEQAEHILVTALEKTPDRMEIILVLLRIYAEQGNISAFEQAALKVRTAAEQGGEEDVANWGKVALQGRQIDPNNPIYHIEDLDTLPGFDDPSEPVQDDNAAELTPQYPVESDNTPSGYRASVSHEPLRSVQESNVLEFTFEPLSPEPDNTPPSSREADHAPTDITELGDLGLDALFPEENEDTKKQRKK